MQNQKQKNLGLVLGIAVAILAVAGLASVFPSASNEGYAPEQPIPFSHKLHAGQYKLACIYCHTGVEKSAHATVPPMNVCMNCHSVVKPDSPWIQKLKKAFAEGRPIEWVRVHELPDHVRFTHQPHIAAGVSCETCHGNVREETRIEQLRPLTMGWCIECHRGQTTPRDVLARYYPNTQSPHGGVAPTNCDTCHF